tara:strand:- start:766 stop:1248 length:483 start_codon:yes stop_codon:yes gene_type:complete
MRMSDENEILIIYGSETGNAEALADDAGMFAKKMNLESRVMDMDDISVDDLSNSKFLLICCSTWGEGDQPMNAEDLYQEACDSDENSMDGVNFAVLALGDTDYEFFCESGKEWDAVIEQKSGNRINKRIDCDVDYEDTTECEDWIKETLQEFSEISKGAA